MSIKNCPDCVDYEKLKREEEGGSGIAMQVAFWGGAVLGTIFGIVMMSLVFWVEKQ